MIEDIARRYRGRWLQGYARGKLRRDPAYAAVYERVKGTPLPLLDVGCGIGLLPAYLRARGYPAELVGFDFDARKIESAARVADAGMRFYVSSVAEPLPAVRGHVVMLDLLHYLEPAAQRDLLARAVECVAPGGCCVVRECLRDASWRFRITQLEERFIHAISWMKSGAIHFPSAEEVIAPFRARGFAAEVRPLWGRTPFNSHLIVMSRAPEPRVSTVATLAADAE